MVRPLSFTTKLKKQWDTYVSQSSLQAPFFAFDWHALWYQTLANDWQPYTLLIDNHVIAPLARRENEIIFSGGYEVADYLDIIGSEDNKKNAWSTLLTYLRKDGIKRLHLGNIPEHSPTLQVFQTQKTATISQEDTTPIIHLPNTWDAYKQILTKKYRHELERKMRKFEREHEDFTIRESKNPSADIHILISLMQKDPQKRLFLTPQAIEFFQQLAVVFSQSISLFIVMLDKNPAAATLSFMTDESYMLYNSGFDRTCCQNAGFYLKATSIKHAIEKGFAKYNFLQGNERYKYELGGENFGVFEVNATL